MSYSIPRANVAIRFLSSVIDLLVLSALAFAINFLTKPNLGFYTHMQKHEFVLCCVVILYYLPEAIAGQTLGKKLLGLAILDEKTGKLAGYRLLFARFILKCALPVMLVSCELLDLISGGGMFFFMMFIVGVPTALLTFVILLGNFMILFPKRQTFHDRASGTIIVKKSNLVAGAKA